MATRKKERINRVVWWKDVVEAQLKQKTASQTLSLDAKAWFLHPVRMLGFNQLINLEILIAAHPSGNKKYYNQILPYLNEKAMKYQIYDKKEIAHFISQIAHESQFNVIEESLYYSIGRMKEIYGCKNNQYDKNKDECILQPRLRPKLWSTPSFYARNPQNLGNYIYANRMGNGNEESGDGYKFRGRGMMQITGKENYIKFTNFHNLHYPHDKKDFVSDPDLLITEMKYGIESAFVFWVTKPNLRKIARNGTVREVTKKINGGLNGYDDRKKRFNNVAKILGIPIEV